jgi:hypothetical protein
MTDIHDHIRQLTRPHTHNERYEHNTNGTTWTSQHTTLVPALIDQLADVTATSGGEHGTGGYKSRPAAWLEPLDTLALIDHEAAKWVRKLGEDDPADTKAVLSKLHGLHASATGEQKRDIERDVRNWWTQARIISGWDSPAWRPDNTCPMCNERRALRIKLADHIGFCVECRATWEPTNIALLAEHIRAENREDDDSEGDAA